MSIVIEHDKRRQQILKKALDVFMEEGYKNATYQKIADRCKITRTTLYLYFRNKQEIFNYSIKQFMAEVEQDILGVKENKTLSNPAKLKKTLLLILSRMEENRLLLFVVLDYLFSRKPTQPRKRVRRRTIRLRRLLSALLIDGIKSGQLKKIDVRATNDLLYSLLESAILHLTVLKQESAADMKKSAEALVESISS